MSRTKVSVIDTDAGPNLLRTSILPVKWRSCIRLIHKMSLQSESNNHVNVIDKIMLFVQLVSLHVRFHFGVVDNLALPLLIETQFIDMFVKEIIPMKRCIVPIQSRPEASVSEYTLPSDPPAVLKSHSDAGTDSEDQQDNNARTLIFRVAKCVAIRPNTEASVSVSTTRAGLI